MQNHNIIEYKLDVRTIQSLQSRMNAFPNFIDPFRLEEIKLRFISRGRQVIQLKEGMAIWIVVERDQSTRYIVNRSQQNAGGGRKLFESMMNFEGYKMESNKYLQYGQFHHFQLVRLKEEISYRYLSAQTIENTHKFDFAKAKEGYHLLAYKNQQKIVYLDDKFNEIMQQLPQTPEEDQCESIYFGIYLSQNILAQLEDGSYINSKAINYFFKRLAYSCTSRQWLAAKKGPTLIIEEVMNWKVLPVCLDRIKGEVPSEGWFLRICPICETSKQHFVLIGLQIKNGSILTVFELDSLGQLLIAQPREGLNIVQVADLNGPKQYLGADCGLFCLIYTLLIAHRYQLLPLPSQTLSILCNQQTITNTMPQLRRLLSESYRNRNYHFLEDVLQALRE